MQLTRFFSIAFVISLTLVSISCKGSDIPSSPAAPKEGSPAASANAAGRVMLGLWNFTFQGDSNEVEVTPVRTASMHLNVVYFLENAGCSDCLQVIAVVDLGDGVKDIRVQLKHPYHENLHLSMFDVRGIFITESNYYFPEEDKYINWGNNHPRLFNPDGYTFLYNPVNFPEDSPQLPWLKYITGDKAVDGNLNSTLNPYVTFEKDEERRYFADSQDEEHFYVKFIPGANQFGYAVDASWMPYSGDISDPVKDLPPEANCPEAYKIRVLLGDGVKPEYGGTADILVEVFDEQGLDTISGVFVQCPDLFDGETELSYKETSPTGGFIYEGQVSNSKGANNGDYPLLVKVTDTALDPHFGAINAYQVVNVGVQPDSGWVVTMGASGNDSTYGFSCDSLDNALLCGSGGSGVDLDPGPGVVHNFGGFFMNLDTDRDLLWSTSFSAYRFIKTDSQGNIIALYVGQIEKLNPFGELIWQRPVAHGIECERWEDLAFKIDSSDNMYVAGKFEGIVDFDPSPGGEYIVEAGGDSDAFVSKLDPEGNFLWVKTNGGAAQWGGGNNYPPNVFCDDNFKTVAVDNSGNVFVAGEQFLSAEEKVGVAFKFDSDGNQIWTAQWPLYWDPEYHMGWGGLTSWWTYQYATIYGDVDSNGNFYVTHDNVDEDEFEHQTEFRLKRFGPSGGLEFDSIWDISDCYGFQSSGFKIVDDVLNIVGFQNGTLDFDPGPGVDERDSDDGVLFWLKLSMDRDYISTVTWTGNSYYNIYITGFDIDSNGNAFFAGDFKSTVDFDPGPSEYEVESHGQNDMFLTKLMSDGTW